MVGWFPPTPTLVWGSFRVSWRFPKGPVRIDWPHHVLQPECSTPISSHLPCLGTRTLHWFAVATYLVKVAGKPCSHPAPPSTLGETEAQKGTESTPSSLAVSPGGDSTFHLTAEPGSLGFCCLHHFPPCPAPLQCTASYRPHPWAPTSPPPPPAGPGSLGPTLGGCSHNLTHPRCLQQPHLIGG